MTVPSVPISQIRRPRRTAGGELHLRVSHEKAASAIADPLGGSLNAFAVTFEGRIRTNK